MSKKDDKLPEDTRINVVLQQEMTVAEYYERYDSFVKDGWHIQGYEPGYYQNNLNTKKI